MLVQCQRLTRPLDAINDAWLSLMNLCKDLVEAVMDETGDVANDPLLTLDYTRLLVYSLLFLRVAHFQLIVLVNHVHLLLLEDFHDVL